MRKTILILMTLTLIQFISVASATADEGYFLSFPQKGELIWMGRMQDAAGDWYDVRIVPGYVAPTKMARKYLLKTGSDFAEYVSAAKYRNLARKSRDAYKWAYKDALLDFTLKGTPKAWRSYFSAARKTTEKRAFGWWFAYPWALFISLTDNAVRIPLGLGGMAAGTVWGTAVVPAYYLTDSTVKGTWHLTTGGLLLPASGYAWNTAISPPLALLGQKPAPSRTDGFWVRRLDPQEIRQVLEAEIPLTDEDMDCLAQWGRILNAELEPFETKQKQIYQRTDEAIKAVYNERNEALNSLAEERKGRLREVLQDPQNGEILESLREGPIARIQVQSWGDELRKHLAAKGVGRDEAGRLIRVLEEFRRYFGEEIRPIEKTDPVQQLIYQAEKL